MLQIFQHYMNQQLSDVQAGFFYLFFFQAGFRKGSETRDQVANMGWIIVKAIEFQENIYFCFIDYTKAFDYVNHN